MCQVSDQPSCGIEPLYDIVAYPERILREWGDFSGESLFDKFLFGFAMILFDGFANRLDVVAEGVMINAAFECALDDTAERNAGQHFAPSAESDREGIVGRAELVAGNHHGKEQTGDSFT